MISSGSNGLVMSNNGIYRQKTKVRGDRHCVPVTVKEILYYVLMCFYSCL